MQPIAGKRDVFVGESEVSACVGGGAGKGGKVLGGERGASEFSLGLSRQKSSLAARSPTVPQVQLLSRRRPFLKSNSFPDHHGHTRRAVRAFSEDHLRRPHPAPPPSPTSLGLGDDVHGEGPDGRHSSRPPGNPIIRELNKNRRPHDPGRLAVTRATTGP
jgi:hypothetical protein